MTGNGYPQSIIKMRERQGVENNITGHKRKRDTPTEQNFSEGDKEPFSRFKTNSYEVVWKPMEEVWNAKNLTRNECNSVQHIKYVDSLQQNSRNGSGIYEICSGKRNEKGNGMK